MEASIDAPADVFTNLFDRLAAWLGWDGPQPIRQSAEDPETAGAPAPKPTDDNGTCLDPTGTPVPCKP